MYLGVLGSFDIHIESSNQSHSVVHHHNTFVRHKPNMYIYIQVEQIEENHQEAGLGGTSPLAHCTGSAPNSNSIVPPSANTSSHVNQALFHG